MEKSGAFCPALRCELQALSSMIALEVRRLDPNKNRSAFSIRPFFNGLLIVTVTGTDGTTYAVTAIFESNNSSFTLVPTTDWPEDTYTITATIADALGNVSAPATWHVMVDRTPLQFAYSNPPYPNVSASNHSADLQIQDPTNADGTPGSGIDWTTVTVTDTSGNPISATQSSDGIGLTGLANGIYDLIVTASDNAGNPASFGWHFLVATDLIDNGSTLSVTVNDGPVPDYVHIGDTLVVKATDTSDGAQVSLTVTGGNPDPASDGPNLNSATVTVAANQAGTHQITITASNDIGETQTYVITVEEILFLEVTGATPLVDGITYITPIQTAGDVVIYAALYPDVSPSELPADFITWTGGAEGDDQAHRKVTKTVADSTDVTATCGTSSQTVTIKVVEVLSVTCVSGATQTNVTGADNWATIKNSDTVIIAAVLYPEVDPYSLPADFVTWDGGDDGGDQLHRTVPTDVSEKTVVTAYCGISSGYVNVWVIWATITIKMTESTPPNAIQFGDRYDRTELLGVQHYLDVVGLDVARAKVVPMASITPEGIHEIVKSGWGFERDKMTKVRANGLLWTPFFPSWTDDTSKSALQMLTPDDGDFIYDRDAPLIKNFAPTYDLIYNFRQWTTWNSEVCSDYTYWYFKASWDDGATPKYGTPVVAPGQQQLPE